MRTILACLVFICAIATFPNSPASASDSMTDELRGELAAIAAQTGISFEEASRNHQYREDASEAIDAVLADAKSFAGAYHDRAHGTWSLSVQYVAGSSDERDRVAALLPTDVPVHWNLVERSYADLERIREQVIQRWKEIGLAKITGTSISASQNRVVIATPQPDEEILKEFSERYGDAVSFRVDSDSFPVACAGTNDPEGGSRFHCTPWRGGIEAQTMQNLRANRCTFTMWAKNKSIAGAFYLITAGHCGNISSQEFWHNAISVGVSTVNSLQFTYPNSDSRRVPATATTSMNIVYETPTTKSYAIDHLAGSQIEGDWVCKLGVGGGDTSTFGRQCGQIIDQQTDFVSINGKLVPAKQADFNGSGSGSGLAGGDSGASVVYNGALFGLVAMGDGKYVTASNIQSDLNVWFCMNASCSLP
jgi:hypothetical protein